MYLSFSLLEFFFVLRAEQNAFIFIGTSTLYAGFIIRQFKLSFPSWYFCCSTGLSLHLRTLAATSEPQLTAYASNLFSSILFYGFN